MAQPPENDPVRYYGRLSPSSRLLLGLVIAANLKDDKRLLELLNTGDHFLQDRNGKGWTLAEVSLLKGRLDLSHWETGSANRCNRPARSFRTSRCRNWRRTFWRSRILRPVPV